MASTPLRYKLAGCGFWTTFGALLARNAITIAMVQLSAAPSLSTSNKTGENDVEFCRVENVTDGVELRDHQFSYDAEIVWSHRQRALMLSVFFLGHAFGFLVVGPVLGKFGVRHSITFVLLSFVAAFPDIGKNVLSRCLCLTPPARSHPSNPLARVYDVLGQLGARYIPPHTSTQSKRT